MNGHKILFIIVAVVSSVIYGVFAYEIHDSLKDKKERPTICNFNQYWMNGLFALVGWTALYYFLFYRLGYFSVIIKYDFNPYDLLIVLIAMLGITGNLSRAIFVDKLFGKN